MHNKYSKNHTDDFLESFSIRTSKTCPGRNDSISIAEGIIEIGKKPFI